MQVDIKLVGALQQDFRNKIIRVLSKQNFCMWEQQYTNEEAFNKAFKQMSRKFSAELKRRETELNKV